MRRLDEISQGEHSEATYFSTVNLTDRKRHLLTEEIALFRNVMRKIRQSHPFDLIAMVVLPDHLHAIWRMPEADADFQLRWSLIKAAFSRGLPRTELMRHSRKAKQEREIWQRWYWEHQIRDDDDLEKHVAYIHFNPVKPVMSKERQIGHIRRFIERSGEAMFMSIRDIRRMRMENGASNPGG